MQDAQAALVAPPPRGRVREAKGEDGEEAPSKKRTSSAAGERKPKAWDGSETRLCGSWNRAFEALSPSPEAVRNETRACTVPTSLVCIAVVLTLSMALFD